MEHDRPQIDRLIAARIGPEFTLGELRIGVAAMDTPASMTFFKAIAAAKEAGKPSPDPSPEAVKTFQRLIKDKDGRSFLDKLTKFNSGMMKDLEQPMAVEMVPGLLRRFGEKAEAAEARRKAAAG
jgi:hypothetical protein